MPFPTGRRNPSRQYTDPGMGAGTYRDWVFAVFIAWRRSCALVVLVVGLSGSSTTTCMTLSGAEPSLSNLEPHAQQDPLPNGPGELGTVQNELTVAASFRLVVEDAWIEVSSSRLAFGRMRATEQCTVEIVIVNRCKRSVRVQVSKRPSYIECKGLPGLLEPNSPKTVSFTINALQVRQQRLMSSVGSSAVSSLGPELHALPADSVSISLDNGAGRNLLLLFAITV